MLSTIELEQYIKREILNKLKNVNWEKINFKEGSDNSIEGTYIFCKNGKYHILFTEKEKDFRRALFKKELELCSLFGETFEKKKKKELEEILKRNPYNDI